MFCINCFNPKTNVTNSRTKSKRPAVWRRRHCVSCGKTFTTYETPSISESQSILSDDGSSHPFNLGRLILSIAGAFQHNPEAAKNDSLWLARSIEESLITNQSEISSADIAAITHQALKRYDELAAIQYAAKHQLLTSTKRRPGRPPLKSS